MSPLIMKLFLLFESKTKNYHFNNFCQLIHHFHNSIHYYFHHMLLFCDYIFITLQERIRHLSATPKTVFIMLVCLHFRDYLFITLQQRNCHLFHDAYYYCFITPKWVFIMLGFLFSSPFTFHHTSSKKIITFFMMLITFSSQLNAFP